MFIMVTEVDWLLDLKGLQNTGSKSYRFEALETLQKFDFSGLFFYRMVIASYAIEMARRLLVSGFERVIKRLPF